MLTTTWQEIRLSLSLSLARRGHGRVGGEG